MQVKCSDFAVSKVIEEKVETFVKLLEQATPAKGQVGHIPACIPAIDFFWGGDKNLSSSKCLFVSIPLSNQLRLLQF
jgi:hypothetical protein